MQNEIGFHSSGHRHSSSGDFNWMSVTTVLDQTQTRHIEDWLRAWCRPGLLRRLGYRFGQPCVIEISEMSTEGYSRLRLIFRDEHNRLVVARSYAAQIELAQIIASTLGWYSFKFRHRSTEDLRDFMVQREGVGVGSPWRCSDVTPVQPPQLARSTQLHYRHT